MIAARLRAAAAAIVIVLSVVYVAAMASQAKGFDFRAFYCAGLVAGGGADPYRTQPLHACERYGTDAEFAAFARETVLPAPIPGYAIAFVEPLAMLPFKTALALWTGFLALCIVFTAAGLWRLTGFPFAAIVAAVTLCDALASLSLGELMPPVLCALVYCALFVRAGRWGLAGVTAAATLVEPHVGVPVCLSLACWAPRSRPALAAAFAALAGASVAAIGIASNIEYIREVLPYHALAEIGADAQLSTSAVLHALHWHDNLAIAVGTCWYLVMLFAGVVFARKLADTVGNDAFWIVTPPAFAVLGGVFVHVTQTAAALPFAILLLRYAPEYAKPVAAALVLIAIPWVWSGTVQFSPIVFILGAYIAWEAFAPNIVVGFAAAAIVVTMLALFNNPAMHSPRNFSPAYSVHIPSAYAEAQWAKENALHLSDGGPAAWLRRTPTWAGLSLLLGAAIYAGTRRTVTLYA